MAATKETKLTPESVMAAVNKQFGKGTMKMASDPSLTIMRVGTGSLVLDEMFHGGIARGRFIEIYGSEGIGKNAIAYLIIAAIQQAGGRAAFVDCENRFHQKFAAHLGVDLKTLAFHEQDSGPVVVDFMDTLIRSHLYNVIVMDSIAALIPEEERSKSMSAATYGMGQAKLMSQALRKLTSGNTSQGTILVFLNQTREAIGVMFGPKTTTSGGRAMRFYASTRLELNRVETIKRKARKVNHKTGEITQEDAPAGHRIQARVQKDSTGVREGEMTTMVFDYDLQNFDRIEDLIYLGRLYGLVHKKKAGAKKKGDPKPKAGEAEKGAAYWWVDEYESKKVLGRNAFKQFLIDNPKIATKLEEWIRNSFESDEDNEGE